MRLRQRALVFAEGDRIQVTVRDHGIAFRATPSTIWAMERLGRGLRCSDAQELADADGIPARAEEIRSLVEALDGIGALERLDLPHGFAPDELDRHSRTFDFLSSREGASGDRFTMQARVAAADVLLIGVGGLGSWIAYGLVALGVGRLRLCDPDTVELSNLNRSVLFDASSVGRLKVDVAAERLTAFAPRLRVDSLAVAVTGPADAARLAAGSDLIIGVADQPHRAIRRWVAGGGLLAGVPVLDAGGGRVGPFYYPGESSCSGCLQATLAEPGSRRDRLMEQEPAFPRRSPGTLAPYPAADAAVVTLEAYRHLSGLAVPATKNAYLTEGETFFDGTRTELPPHPRCRVCAGTAVHLSRPATEGGEWDGVHD